MLGIRVVTRYLVVKTIETRLLDYFTAVTAKETEHQKVLYIALTLWYYIIIIIIIMTSYYTIINYTV